MNILCFCVTTAPQLYVSGRLSLTLLYVFRVTFIFNNYYFLFQIVINYLLLHILNNYFFSNYLFVLMYLFLLFLLVIDLFVITIPPIRILCPHKLILLSWVRNFLYCNIVLVTLRSLVFSIFFHSFL